MIEPAALEHLAELLIASGLAPDLGLRLEPDGERFRLAPDRPAPSDRVWRHQRRVVLMAAPEVQLLVGGRRVSIEADSGELRLATPGADESGSERVP